MFWKHGFHQRMPGVLERLSLDLLSKLVMPLILGKHFVVFEHLPASLNSCEIVYYENSDYTEH